MTNPWNLLSSVSPYVLETDKTVVESFNEDVKPQFEHQLQYFPEPFLGDVINAKVLLLNLNPGVDILNKQFHRQEKYLVRANNNIRHQPQDFPFFLLDQELEGLPGHEWWSKKLKRLISETSVEKVAKGIACIELHGYPSERYKHISGLESMKYSKYLVEKAMERKAFLIIMRGQKFWQSIVPNLSEYGNKSHVINVQNPCITPNNLCDSKHYDHIKSLL